MSDSLPAVPDGEPLPRQHRAADDGLGRAEGQGAARTPHQSHMLHGDRTDLDRTAVVGILPAPHLIAGSLSASDLAAVFNWIDLNRAALLEHWNGTIDGGEMAARSRRLP